MTAREGVSMQEVGLACLSPGFQTHDPVLREQLQRSLSVRDQQRSIIEARMNKSGREEGPAEGTTPSESSLFGPAKSGPGKKRPPPGLSIVPPSASQFANERVIQSAPLHQTFTGRREPQPLTRHVVNHPPTLGSTSHIHHVPATQTNNRLPPLADVFGPDPLPGRDRDRDVSSRGGGYYPAPGASGSTSSQSNRTMQPLPSPGLAAPPPQHPARPREYRSAEEAVQELAGGRDDLLPRLVHYGGHQPPTPPSPHVTNGPSKAGQSGESTAPPHHEPMSHLNIVPPPPPPPPTNDATARRRPRSEYEHDSGSPPLGHGPDPHYRLNPALAAGPNAAFHGPFGAGRDSPEMQRRKKEEFLSLCARAWDLFHS